MEVAGRRGGGERLADPRATVDQWPTTRLPPTRLQPTFLSQRRSPGQRPSKKIQGDEQGARSFFYPPPRKAPYSSPAGRSPNVHFRVAAHVSLASVQTDADAGVSQWGREKGGRGKEGKRRQRNYAARFPVFFFSPQ